MEYNYLGFDINIGKSKPENIVHREVACPICDVKSLKNIIEIKNDMILLENKYQVLQEAYQLLIIEGSECNADIPDYTLEHMQELMHFSINHWLNIINSKKYKTVLFFKNHGPLSGGTMRHPHMQIVGIKNLEFKNMCDKRQFEGIKIAKKNNVVMNLSTKPRVGFTEVNVIMQGLNDIDTLAEFVQIGVDYIMNHFSVNCSSYNLFFYLIEGNIHVKIMPRFATSPLFIGYNIELVPNNLQGIAKHIKQLYFDKKND